MIGHLLTEAFPKLTWPPQYSPSSAYLSRHDEQHTAAVLTVLEGATHHHGFPPLDILPQLSRLLSPGWRLVISFPSTSTSLFSANTASEGLARIGSVGRSSLVTSFSTKGQL